MRSAKYLLEKGANPNARNLGGKGDTILSSIAPVADAEMVLLLLSYGADPNETRHGQKAEDFARGAGNSEVVEVLRNHSKGE